MFCLLLENIPNDMTKVVTNTLMNYTIQKLIKSVSFLK